jgi:acetyl-CoA C-acetyltransferase/acetyl-CoA acyltransferase
VSGDPLVLAAGVRTPLARAGGAFAKEDAGRLGALVARELLARAPWRPDEVDELVAGCVGVPHDQANVGRVVAVRAGLPTSTPARTVQRNCASGMEAVDCAAMAIESGRARLVLCVGVEVMSRYPLCFGEAATAWFERLSRAKSPWSKLAAFAGLRPSMLAPKVALLEGLTDPLSGLIMGRTAELLAREWSISREDADRFALRSHDRARAARDSGRLAREIVPVLPLEARPGAGALSHDDSIRDGQTLEALAKLPPWFEKPDGRVTVGNSCGITDGACALLVCRESFARAAGVAPLARLVGRAWSGCDPARMGLGPVQATARLLRDTGRALADMDVVEINEAFAAQVLACEKAFDSAAHAREHWGGAPLGQLDWSRTNANGGAIALGHPVGATGARLLLTAAHELAARGGGHALATLCIGGGQGGAFLLEGAA